MANTPTIPVHVQTQVDDPVFFVDWPIDQLDDVIHLLAKWDLVDFDAEVSS